MVIAKKYVLNRNFEGVPKPSDLTLVEEHIPALNDGEFLIKAEYLSVDPYMRAWGSVLPVGSTMIGSQIAEIVASKNKNFPVGRRVVANIGWSTYTVVNEKSGGQYNQPPYLLPDFGSLPASLGLGVLGMPGNTAYFGFIEICQPKSGETLVVSGAAGAVGSHVGQIGKILGLKVIGIAGSDVKCKWLTEELGFDHAINYKTEDVAEALKKAAPNKVDCYFDNVGGDISNIVLKQLNKHARISLCGSISGYNTTEANAWPTSYIDQMNLLLTESKLEGFIVFRWQDRWLEGIEKNLQWIKENKLKYQETVTEGFENIFDAFAGMLKGENIGKAIVKV